MTEDTNSELNMLDVGFGTVPRGDVNVDFFRSGFNPQTEDQIKGGFMSPKKVKNMVLGDALHLPFKDSAFNFVFSSHTIEHVSDPLLMLREMCRVSKRKVAVRCPHRKGSGAIRPYHINYFDENWFKKASNSLGFKGTQFISAYEYPISPQLERSVPAIIKKTIPWRALRHFERNYLIKKIRVRCEIEAWFKKQSSYSNTGNIKFIVVYNRPKIFEKCFASSPFISLGNVIAYPNTNNEPLPNIYNKLIQEHLQEDVWFAFCHQDFVLMENLQNHLRNKDIEAIYGPIGGRISASKLVGSITQKDGTSIGSKLEQDTPVQTLDEMCMIIHSKVFRNGLLFDKQFGFHFYGADICMQAYIQGFDVLATQLKCEHKSTTVHGDITSSEYSSSLRAFREKWKKFLSIRTTTAIVSN